MTSSQPDGTLPRPTILRSDDLVSPGTEDADDFRFHPYTLDDARRDAKIAGEGLSTGFSVLDAHDFQYQPGKVYAVMARPGVGKTAFLLETIARGAESGRLFNVYVGYEENRHHAYLRLLLRQMARDIAVGGGTLHPHSIPPRPFCNTWVRMGHGGSDSVDAARWIVQLERAAETLDAHMTDGRIVLIDGDAEVGRINHLASHLHRIGEREGTWPSLLVCDYFQKIRPPEGFAVGRRFEQMQEVADQLRRLAKGETLGAKPIPVVVGAQVNREAAKEDDQPDLHHLREGDDLINDAAGVLSLARLPEAGDVLRVKVCKNRDGKRGVIEPLGFHETSGHIALRPPLTSADLLNGASNGTGGRKR